MYPGQQRCDMTANADSIRTPICRRAQWVRPAGPRVPGYSRAASIRAKRGLTLIEVMLAVAIMGIAGIALISAIGQGMAVVRGARLYSHAHTLLARVELEHPLFNDEIDVGVEQGRFDDRELGAFEWRRQIEAVGEEEDRLFLVTTRISWTRSGRRGYEEIAFYRYAPEED